MSDNRKYYWLKLNEDFFEEDTIAYIEEQENGVIYSNFYLKLCLKALKSDGTLIRTVGDMLIPYDANSLSKLTGTNIDAVKVAMDLFLKIGLIQILDSGEIYLSQLNELIGTETEKAKRMRVKRAKEKKLIESENNVTEEGNNVTEEGNNVTEEGNNVTEEGNNVTEMLPECYLEIEKDIDIDIEIKKKKNININYLKIIDKYNDVCTSFPKVQSLSEKRKKAIKARLKKYSEDDLFKAFEKAEASDFLKGANSRDWQASFDWIISDSNIAKILDGNYDNKRNKSAQENKEYGLVL